MRRREFIKQIAVGICAAHEVVPGQTDRLPTGSAEKAYKEAQRRQKVAMNGKTPRGEWPMPGQNNRYLAHAELPCNLPNAPKETWSYDLGRVPIGAALCADVDDDGERE